MKTSSTNLKSKDDIEFHVRVWEPDAKPKAVITFIHGLGDHTGRYEHVASALTDAGYVLAGFDLRGHGKSTGLRGHFPSLEAVMQDIQEFFDFLSGRYPGLPQFLYGHSLGGLLVLTYVLKNKPVLKGVIATSPALRSSIHDQKLKLALVKLLGSLVPTLQLPSELEVAGISHDQNVIDNYNNDPLAHDRITLAFGKAGLSATDHVWSHAQEFPVPLLLMHGTADRVTYHHGSENFSKLSGANNPDVTLKLWEGMYHELHNESVKEQVFEFMIDWLDKHCK